MALLAAFGIFGLLMLAAGAVAIVAIGAIVVIYNGLVGLRNQCENGWSQIDVQLKRRNDLIPNLVETVKGYAKHESETFKAVTEARASMANAKTVKETAEANNMLTGALKTLFAVAENYPQLKANENFMQLQEELTSTENKIAFARQHYNDSTAVYNVARERFPNNVVAGMFGFLKRDYFEIEQTVQRDAPKVQF